MFVRGLRGWIHASCLADWKYSKSIDYLYYVKTFENSYNKEGPVNVIDSALSKHS